MFTTLFVVTGNKPGLIFHLLICGVIHIPLYVCIPIDNTLVCDWGTGIGGCHFRAVCVVRRGTWAALISKARVAF